MAPTVLGGYRNLVITSGFFAFPIAIANSTSVEATKQWPVRVAGSFSNFTITIDANGTGRISNYRQNGADGALSISPGDGLSGQFKNWGVPAHYAVGDTFDLTNRITGGSVFNLVSYSTVFAADSGTAGFYATYLVATGAGGPFWATLGSGWTAGVDTPAIPTIRAPGTASNLLACVTANTNGSATAFISRKNSANGAQSLSVPAGATGFFEDTTHSDTLPAGSTFGFQCTSVATGSLTVIAGCTMTFTGPTSEVPGGNPTYTFNAADQFSTVLYGGTSGTTEASFPMILGIDGSLSKLRCFIFSNSMTGTFTYVLRKNGVNQTNTVSIPATTTGGFEDTTHSDKFLANDTLVYDGSGGVSGAINVFWAMTLLTPAPESASWFEPLSDPVRTKPGLHSTKQQFAAMPELPTVSFSWMEELSKPSVLEKRGLAAARQQFAAYQDNPTTVTPFAWFAPLADPVRVKLGLRAGLQQTFALQPGPSPFVATGWFANLSEPVRIKPGLKASMQQFLAHPAQLRPTPTSFAALNALETPDTFLGGSTEWDAIDTGEVGVVIITAPGGASSVAPANTASPIAYAKVSIVII